MEETKIKNFLLQLKVEPDIIKDCKLVEHLMGKNNLKCCNFLIVIKLILIFQKMEWTVKHWKI